MDSEVDTSISLYDDSDRLVMTVLRTIPSNASVI